jgi:hypothetical protein
MMFLRIAMMDAETLRHIVDLLQEPRSYSNEKEETSATEEAAASAGPAEGSVDPPARARTVRISEPEALPSTRSSTRQDVSLPLRQYRTDFHVLRDFHDFLVDRCG